MTSTDIGTIRETLRGKRGRSYWRSLEELAGTEAFADYVREEWPRLAGVWDRPADRRSVLKILAANMAALGVAGCGEAPEEEIVPYVRRPEEVVPGRPAYYATALALGGYGTGVLAESHTGRPTRVQGNPDHPAGRGASTAIAQAAVLDLYDPDRSQATLHRGQIAGFDRFLGMVAALREQLVRGGGAGFRLLTGRVTSPTLLGQIAALRDAFPDMRWHVHEPVDATNAEAGARLAFGETVETLYRFDRARAVLGLDADFLGVEEPGQLAYARAFMAGRSPGPDGTPPTRLYAVASGPTLTGAAADHRLALPAARVEALARALAARLGIAGIDAPAEPPVDPAWLEALAADLERHAGAAPVVAGRTQPPAVHAIAHAINAHLGNVGETVAYSEPVAAPAGAGIADLAGDIADGAVGTLLVLDSNPAYDAPADLGFAERLKAVPRTIHSGLYVDETARLAEWHVPAAHTLEAWGDVRAFDGTVTIQQPVIRPLHGGRTPAELLAALNGDFDASSMRLVRRYWRERRGGAGFERFWRAALRRGVVPETAAASRKPTLRDDLAERLPGGDAAAEGLSLQFRPDPALWDGRYANNGWLQELPDPLSKLVWGNAAFVAPALAEERGLEDGDVVRLRVGDRALEAPVWLVPGQPRDAVTLHLGYGRRSAGRLGTGVGVDAYALRTTAGRWFAGPLTLEPTGRRASLASTQHHHVTEGRGLVRMATWDEFRADPDFAQRAVEQDLPSLYPEPSPVREPGEEGWTPYEWGMAIDFNACIGCNACLVACQSENNIPFVGAQEAARGHAMHWLRIDRYFGGGPDAPDTVFQPVPCMHCENAPCEYVCPVEATQHSSEGLNEMIYNRCIGTRYCSQNCPYKVRRFNFLSYQPFDTQPTPTAAVMNPDVSVRSRGVMEKCTYCVQRISEARINADIERRPIEDGEIVTACQQACPTEAITFGDLNEAGSAVRRLHDDPLNYALLAHLNTRPRTTYLGRLSNPHPELHEPEA